MAKGLIGTVALFGAATIAQAIQWLVDAWQQHQWINFAFALVFAAIVVFGVSAVVKEFRQLRQLKSWQYYNNRVNTCSLIRQSATQKIVLS